MPGPLGEMTYYELIKELQRLNPTAEIKVDEISYDDILSTVPVEKLVLPKGFYFNEKNGITNKHNSKTGIYLSHHVKLIEKTQDTTQTQKVGLLDKIKQKLFTPKEPEREM